MFSNFFKAIFFTAYSIALLTATRVKRQTWVLIDELDSMWTMDGAKTCVAVVHTAPEAVWDVQQAVRLTTPTKGSTTSHCWCDSRKMEIFYFILISNFILFSLLGKKI